VPEADARLMFAAVSTTPVSTTAVSTTTVSAAATTANHCRCTAIAAMNDRCTAITAMNDRCMRMPAMNAAGMSAMPVTPAVAAAPADAGREILTAPVPAWAVPTVVIPAIMATEPNELRALDHIQAIGCCADRSRRDHRGRVEAHYRRARKENGCGRDRDHEFTHGDLVNFDLERQRRAGLFVPENGIKNESAAWPHQRRVSVK
jgi:hypothetical protein